MGLPFPVHPTPRPPFPGPSKLQIPVKHRTTSTYNWDLGISVPVKIQKSSDNYQNVRIMLAVLRFKKMGKIMLVFSNCATNYASTIYKSQAGRQQPGSV